MKATPLIRYSLIEYMPLHLRGSHIAAGNSGVYPHNGAERIYVAGDIDTSGFDPRWTTVLADGLRELPTGETAIDPGDIPSDVYGPGGGDEPDSERTQRADHELEMAKDRRVRGER